MEYIMMEDVMEGVMGKRWRVRGGAQCRAEGHETSAMEGEHSVERDGDGLSIAEHGNLEDLISNSRV